MRWTGVGVVAVVWVVLLWVAGCAPTPEPPPSVPTVDASTDTSSDVSDDGSEDYVAVVSPPDASADQASTTIPSADSAQTALIPVAWSALPSGWENKAALMAWASALEQSATYYDRIPDRAFVFGPDTRTGKALARGCRMLIKAARTGDAKAVRVLLTRHFRLYQSKGSASVSSARPGKPGVLVTGYYEPLLRGAMQPNKTFRYPLYRRPPDLVEADLSLWFPDLAGRRIVGRAHQGRLARYYDRAAIDQDRKLAGQGLELVWTDDELDVFFLQIQGSGRVALPDGTHMRVGYDGSNGHVYRSIGKRLIDDGHISAADMSLPALRQWLISHPKQRRRILFHNPSYVFFQALQGGPYGNIQVALTPGYSIATDHRLFPRGAPAMLVTELPQFGAEPGRITAWKPETRFVANQDTGGAIRGPGRVDLFLGFGDLAEQTAGVMKQPGALFFIAPRAVVTAIPPKKR
jgi:membrane-bound lytic murein transglycosylase A